MSGKIIKKEFSDKYPDPLNNDVLSPSFQSEHSGNDKIHKAFSGNQRDLTQGNLLKTLITFSIPFFVANLLQALYGAVDLFIVGRYAAEGVEGVGCVAAVACGSQVMTLIALAVIGLTTAGTVLIGRFYGSKELERIHTCIGTMLTCFFFCSFLLMVLMFLLSDSLLYVLKTPEDAVDGAREYIYICSAGTIFIFGYNTFSAILRGVGNSRSPMIFVGIACLTNLLVDLLLVGYFQMGAIGAAYATVASQAISMIFAIVYIKRQHFLFDFKWKSFRVDFGLMKKLFVIGLPLSVQAALIDLSFLLIFSIINTMGVAASAGYGICCRLNGFTMLPAISFGMAITAIVAQNLGAGKPDRALASLKLGIMCTLSITIFLFCWMEFWPETAFAIFTNNPDVIAAGSLYMKSFCFDILMVTFVFCGNGLLNGSGHTRFTFVNSVIPTFLIRVPVAWFISRLPNATLYGVGFAAPLASLLSIAITIIYLRTGRWKIPRI